MTTQETESSNELTNDQTTLAAKRTLMAADRSLMAWIRTALSMISFGFTIYKLLQAFQASGGVLRRPDSPRNIGLFLIGLGTVSLVLGTIEYWGTLREMLLLHHFRILRPTFVIALIMSVTGVILFVSIISRLL